MSMISPLRSDELEEAHYKQAWGNLLPLNIKTLKHLGEVSLEGLCNTNHDIFLNLTKYFCCLIRTKLSPKS